MHWLDPNLWHAAALIAGTMPLMGLSLLGLGGGGGLGISGGQTSTPISTGSTVTVNNAGSSSGGFSTSNQTLLIVGAAGLLLLLLFGLFRGGRRGRR